MRWIPVLALPLLLSACTTVVRHEGQKIDRAQVLNLKAGETTKNAVLDAFGTPTEVTYENNAEKMVYTYKEKAVPAILDGLVQNEIHAKDTVVTLEVFVRDNTVHSYRFSSSSGD